MRCRGLEKKPAFVAVLAGVVWFAACGSGPNRAADVAPEVSSPGDSSPGDSSSGDSSSGDSSKNGHDVPADGGGPADVLTCPDGLRPGLCGLAGRCVECVVDDDCAAGRVCDFDGTCVAACTANGECPVGYQDCREGHCRLTCHFGAVYCPAGSYCDDEDVCVWERCGPDQPCPEGWRSEAGKLRCLLDSCAGVGMRDGGCGLGGHCVECNVDEDCVFPETCDRLAGFCSLAETNCQYLGCEEGGICAEFHCIYPCESPVDCLPGRKCVPVTETMGECVQEVCTADGRCPDENEWVPIPNSLYCTWNPCLGTDRRPGGCGLHGQCVECVVDDECSDGEICDLAGTCIKAACQSAAECGGGVRCADGRCEPSCQADADCGDGSVCVTPPGFCRVVRCAAGGACSVWGWRPTPGTLACHYEPCVQPGTMRGVCGAQQRCVQCVDDSDCAAGEHCDLYGACFPLPWCGPGAPNLDCSPWDVCVDGRCLPACTTGADCQDDRGICMPEGYCFYEPCARDGTCPANWIPGRGRNDVGGRQVCKLRP